MCRLRGRTSFAQGHTGNKRVEPRFDAGLKKSSMLLHLPTDWFVSKILPFPFHCPWCAFAPHDRPLRLLLFLLLLVLPLFRICPLMRLLSLLNRRFAPPTSSMGTESPKDNLLVSTSPLGGTVCFSSSFSSFEVCVVLPPCWHFIKSFIRATQIRKLIFQNVSTPTIYILLLDFHNEIIF